MRHGGLNIFALVISGIYPIAANETGPENEQITDCVAVACSHTCPSHMCACTNRNVYVGIPWPERQAFVQDHGAR
jgi:hypothetical protein